MNEDFDISYRHLMVDVMAEIARQKAWDVFPHTQTAWGVVHSISRAIYHDGYWRSGTIEFFANSAHFGHYRVLRNFTLTVEDFIPRFCDQHGIARISDLMKERGRDTDLTFLPAGGLPGKLDILPTSRELDW